MIPHIYNPKHTVHAHEYKLQDDDLSGVQTYCEVCTFRQHKKKREKISHRPTVRTTGLKRSNNIRFLTVSTPPHSYTHAVLCYV